MTQATLGVLQRIYNRARRICADKAQAHLRDFAEVDNGLQRDAEEKNARSDVQEAA